MEKLIDKINRKVKDIKYTLEDHAFETLMVTALSCLIASGVSLKYLTDLSYNHSCPKFQDVNGDGLKDKIYRHEDGREEIMYAFRGNPKVPVILYICKERFENLGKFVSNRGQ